MSRRAEARRLLSLWGPLFEKYRPHCGNCYVIGIVSATAAGVVDSVYVLMAGRRDRDGCVAVQWAFLALSVAVLAAAVGIRPLAAPVKQWLTVAQELLGTVAAACVVAQSVAAVEVVARVQLWMGCIGPVLLIAKFVWERLLFRSYYLNNKMATVIQQEEEAIQREEDLAQFVLRAGGYSPQCNAERLERLKQIVALITDRRQEGGGA